MLIHINDVSCKSCEISRRWSPDLQFLILHNNPTSLLFTYHPKTQPQPPTYYIAVLMQRLSPLLLSTNFPFLSVASTSFHITSPVSPLTSIYIHR